MTNLEDLKKQFIVDKDHYEKEKLPQYLKTILNFGNIDKNGRVHIIRPGLILIDKISLSLTARFLGNQLEDSITKDMTAEELSLVTGTDTKVVSARLTELIAANVVAREVRGRYAIKPYYVDTFLRELDTKYNNPEQRGKTDLSNKICKVKKKKGIKKDRTKPSTSSRGKEPDIDENFKKKIDSIDKAKYTYFYNLPNWQIKCLAILKLAKDDLKMDSLSTPQIFWIIKGRFRTACSWSTISVQMGKSDQIGYTDSKASSNHPRAGRAYELLHDGEEVLKVYIPSKKDETNK